MKNLKKRSKSKIGKTGAHPATRKTTGRPKDRTHAVNTLPETDEPFQKVFEESPLGMALVGADFRFKKVNSVFCKMLGFTRRELLSKTFLDITFPEESDQDVKSITELINGIIPVFRREKRYLKKNHQTIWGLVTVSVVHNKKKHFQYLLAMIEDVTERKQAEDALRENEKRFSAIFNTSPIGISITRMSDGKIIDANPAISTILGYSREELFGRSTLELGVWIDRANREQFAKILKEKKFIRDYETTYRRKSGEIGTLIVSAELFEISATLYMLSMLIDITERKLMEERTRLSEEHYRTLVETTPDAIIIVNRSADIIFASSKAYDIFGSPKERPMIGMSFLEWIAPEQHASILDRLRTILSDRAESEAREYALRKFDGSPFWGEINSSRLINGRGEVTGLLLVCRDISERKAAAEALGQSEERLQKAQMIAHVGNWELDLKAKKMWGSEEAFRIYGFERISPELPLEQVQHIVLKEDRPSLNQAMDRLIAMKGEYKEEYQIRRANDGKIRSIASIAELVLGPDGTPEKIMGVVQDITDRKNAEETVNLLNHTVKSIGECVSVTDMENIVLYVNQAFLDTYGYTREEVIGKNITDIASAKDVDKQEVLQATLKGGWHGERINQKKDGTEFPIQLSTSTVYDERGKPIALVGVAADITEQKKLQQELLQSQKMQSIGTLAGGIAHDFNNILGIILAYASLLQRHGQDGPKHAESVAAINQAVHRGAALVRQILTFARKTDMEFEAVNINDLIHELVSMLQQTFPKVITLKEIVAKNIPYIVADRSQIHQALLNLCVNARDAMPNGGSLTLKTELASIEQIQEQFPTADHKRYACISVIDSGQGMDGATRLRMFDPFFTTKEKGKGTGLGLSVTYGVMQTHNGFIQTESVLGRGSTFRIYLPVPDSSEDITNNLSELESLVSGGTETILVVEDEELLLNMVNFLLETKGYKVFTAHDGIEAVNIYNEHRMEIDLVISDLGLPGMTGAEVFKKLKQINPEVKITLASGYIDPEIKSELLDAGAKEFIQKPYSPDDILRKVREVLDKKAEVRER
ncbi:MAG: PAS domain S-box protein [Ignavibacteriae bacterium]|nr:MAG: PAS domain S-box protein [Ignavibacteriota bacterium]